VFEAKDVTRFPGTAIAHAQFRDFPVHMLCDVSSEVTPHELAEKLSVENPTGHLIVTGMNPVEVLDRARTFEPSSHTIDYDLGGFNFIFTDSVEEAYFTPIAVTEAWLRTSSVTVSNGKVYHVTLLEYKLGHCVWHIYCGEAKDQHTRTFSTHSYVQLPPAISGTLSDEYLPVKLLSNLLTFTQHTPDHSMRNYSAKATQIANSINPRTTARERWIAVHIAQQMCPEKTSWWFCKRLLWNTLYALSFQWQMFKQTPDIFEYLDERKRNRTIHPTPGGGWSMRVHSTYERQSIPNNPSLLQRLSAFTASAFVFLLPKILFGEFVSHVVIKLDYFHILHRIWDLAEVSWERFLLTTAVIVATSLIPGTVAKVFTRLAGHFWRMLWLPGWINWLFEAVVTEVTGGPGAKIFPWLPGRGWAYQIWLWMVGAYTVLPGLPIMFVIPWYALSVPYGWVFFLILGAILLENLAAILTPCNTPVVPTYVVTLSSTLSQIKWRMPEISFQAKRKVHIEGRSKVVCVPDPTRPSGFRLESRLSTHRAIEYAAPLPWANLTTNILYYGFRFICRVPIPSLPDGYALMPALCNSIHWCVAHPLRWSVVAYNYFVHLLSHHPSLGNCTHVNSMPALPKEEPQMIKRRNVNIPLPTVLVRPANIPNQVGGSAMAVDPQGLAYHYWLEQVQRAYQQQPTLHPNLTPGMDCFWQCVSQYGGTPHMWYSWFMSYTRRRHPANNPVVGVVTFAMIQEFAVASRFGLQMGGSMAAAMQPQGDDRPTLMITLEPSPVDGMLHVKPAVFENNAGPVSNLARILATVRQLNPGVFNDARRAHQFAPNDSIGVPTAWTVAAAGEHSLPTSLTDIADAFLASGHSLVLNAQNQEGFAIDLADPFPGVLPALYTYDLNIQNAPIAKTSDAQLWKSFRKVTKRVKNWMDNKQKWPNSKMPHVASRIDFDTKIGTSASQTADNRARNNQRPNPAMWTILQSELAEQLADFRNLELPAVELEEEVIEYTADLELARRLIADLKAHPSILETRGDALVLQSLDAVLDSYKLENKTVKVPVRCYFGVWGCGKTTKTIEYLKGLTPEERAQTRIVNHTESLRAGCRSKVDFAELRGFNFPTLPSVLTEPSTGRIVFDDAGKYWAGTLDLVLLCNPLVPEILVNGDPMQTFSKFPIPGTQSEYSLNGITALSRLATRYATVSHRGFKLLTDTFGVHTTNEEQGFITHTVAGKHGIPVITSSPRYAQVLAFGGREAYTFSSVQGEDFKAPVEVDVTALEDSVSDPSALVGLTRSNSGVYLHLPAAAPDSVIKAPPTGSDLLNALVYAIRSSNTDSLQGPDWIVKAAFYRHLSWCMPMLPWFAAIGASVPDQAFQLLLPKAATLAPIEDPIVVDHATETLVPASGPVQPYVPEVHMKDKEFRELNTPHGQTNQFFHGRFINPPVHKRADTATYFESVARRLRRATEDDNRRRQLECPRTDMCDEYDKMLPTPPKWTPEKHSIYFDQAVDEYCSKRTEKAVLDKIRKHDPSRTGKDINISLKAQIIKKEEKRHKDAIPGQLIHEYDLHQILTDAAYALFIENEIMPAFPRYIHFYRRLSPEGFCEMYQKCWRKNNGAYSSDVTRWDVGCDAGLLNFDCHMMRRSGFPAEYVTAYENRRLASRSRHGPMATMQPSGDRFTWPVNCIRRAVVTSIVCQLTDEDNAFINGDDAAVDRNCNALTFPDSPWEFKDINGDVVDFSGFSVGGDKPEYSAAGILYRTQILVSRDPSAADKWANYMDLLQWCDMDAPETIAVANMFQTYALQYAHMGPDYFREYLPERLRPLFPEMWF